MTGIYKIENTANGKVYIGQSTSVTRRMSTHFNSLVANNHSNQDLQKDFIDYGMNCFSFSVIEECLTKDLLDREQYWIDVYGGMESDNTYNCRDAGNNGSLSTLTRDRVSESIKGHTAWNKGLTKYDDERVAKYSETLKSNTLSMEHKQQISDTVKQLHKDGKYDYKEIAEKRKAAMRENGTVRKDKGIKRGKYSKEHCEAISRAKLEANRRKRELGLPLRKTSNMEES